MRELDDIVLRGILAGAIGPERAGVAVEAFHRPASVSVRVNPFKVADPGSFAKAHFGTDVRNVPWSPCGFMLEERPRFTLDPLFHCGCYYVQDSSAMAVGEIFRNILSDFRDSGRPLRVLDLCAAPGGKSTDLAASLRTAFGDGFLLVSNEVMRSRVSVLADNIAVWGDPNVVVTSVDPKAFARLEGFFDIIVTDVPCSGEGMFRKNDLAAGEWSEGAVLASARRQAQILRNAAPLVAQGGTLLYSTCTYSTEENEETVDAFLSSHPEYRLVSAAKEVCAVTAAGVVPTGAETATLSDCRRFYPHRAPGEGQFIAVLRRVSGAKTPSILYKDASLPLSKEENALLESFLSSALEKIPPLVFRRQGENIVALPYAFPIPKASVFSAGVTVGRAEKGRLVPHHQFFSAYGNLFREKVDLASDDPRLFSYLHGEEIVSEGGGGYVALLCDGIPLGGGKRVGDKIRNYYPKGLRT